MYGVHMLCACCVMLDNVCMTHVRYVNGVYMLCVVYTWCERCVHGMYDLYSLRMRYVCCIFDICMLRMMGV